MSFLEVFAISMVACVFTIILLISTILLLNYIEEKRKIRRLEKRVYEKYLQTNRVRGNDFKSDRKQADAKAHEDFEKIR